MRLDVYVCTAGLAKSRSRAAELIVKGYVTVNGNPITKPAFAVQEDMKIAVTGEEHPFVGRGGMKLEGALQQFGLPVENRICADIGASTGGFTDCLLRHGASHVYAVDAGHGQLDEQLRRDSRVTNLEGCNARYLCADTLPEPCSCAVMDLSFISQTLVLPAVRTLLEDGGFLVSLIKPQFECGKEALGKGGLVRDKKQHTAAIRRVLSSAAACGLFPQKIMKSPVPGGDGNTEFLYYAVCGQAVSCVTEQDIAQVVRN